MCWVLAALACGEITGRARYLAGALASLSAGATQLFVMRSLLRRDRLDINSVHRDKSPALSCRPCT